MPNLNSEFKIGFHAVQQRSHGVNCKHGLPARSGKKSVTEAMCKSNNEWIIQRLISLMYPVACKFVQEEQPALR